MSGGSLDYIYSRINEAADSVRDHNKNSPLHVAFADHLKLVAKALHDCEWVMSCDYGDGDDHASIRAVIHPGSELGAARKAAEDSPEVKAGSEDVGFPLIDLEAALDVVDKQTNLLLTGSEHTGADRDIALALDRVHAGLLQLPHVTRISPEATRSVSDAEYFLRIYEHAHTTGNSVPPNIEAQARAFLSSTPKPEATTERLALISILQLNEGKNPFITAAASQALGLVTPSPSKED